MNLDLCEFRSPPPPSHLYPSIQNESKHCAWQRCPQQKKKKKTTWERNVVLVKELKWEFTMIFLTMIFFNHTAHLNASLSASVIHYIHQNNWFWDAFLLTTIVKSAYLNHHKLPVNSNQSVHSFISIITATEWIFIFPITFWVNSTTMPQSKSLTPPPTPFWSLTLLICISARYYPMYCCFMVVWLYIDVSNKVASEYMKKKKFPFEWALTKIFPLRSYIFS